MASTYQSALAMSLAVTETFDSTTMPFVNSGASQVTHTGIDKTATLNATSTPAISKIAAGQKAMTAGAATIDLTAVTHNGASVTLNGLKLVAMKFRNPSSQSNAITITKGASNGYTVGGGTFTVTLEPGQEWQHYFYTTGEAVSGTVKTIDISGTTTDSIDYIFLAG